ncbi:unnamed protein product [Cyprideis torosa]|uniref:Uncharacterized protein n=1 Tax=Cyprideis torosa TaxID=163714 RepID=A0A7R8ZLH8_9CRUS|nr:unnamed protein product [Cyprideis torosa]CAG0891880.1 unnamed protein product [Cyprideis torosa]
MELERTSLSSWEAFGEILKASNPVNLEWEEKLVEVVQNFSFHGQVRGFVQAAKSFEEVAEHSIWKDVPLLAASFVAMYIFVILAIGNQHPITHRVILALCGMTSIMMAVCVAISLCSAIGLPYSPVHNILPILLQGLGVDDLFVILQCWDSLPDGLGPSLPVRLGKTMRHAGVAVTITSLTDFAAFSVGSTTVLPCLRSFCLYAALGVLCTYLFQLSFFLACFSLVQRRLGTHSEADGFGRCIPTKTSSEPDLSDTFQRRFCTALFWKPIKAVVILISLALLGLNLYGLWNLRQEFDVTWFVPADSYISKFLSAHRRYFPDRGLIGHAFFGPWSYTCVTEDYSALVNTSDRLEQSGLLLNLESWPVKLQAWNEEYFPREEGRFIQLVLYLLHSNNHLLILIFLPVPDLLNRILPPRNFTQRLSRFLSSPSGAKYQRDFHFSSPLSCDEDLPPFTAFRLTFNMRLPSSSREKVQTMNALREILDSSGYSGHTLAWSPYFAGWETDRFIETELWSNMGLAMLCVLLVTIVLIAHPGAAFSVLAMVCLTLVDVAGTMYLWGLTIEIVTSLNLILAVGLCVDYSAHMAHSFMIQRHSLREERAEAAVNAIGPAERAEAAVNAIGPAVLKGGLSTMLSFMFLALSVSYVFDVFFKVFLLTCLYGLFNAMLLLPVLLSLGGPKPLTLATENGPTSDQEKENGPTSDPEKENGPTSEQEKENGPTSDQEKENGPTSDPEKENGPTSDPEKENGPTSDPEKENGPTSDPEKENGPTSDPEKENGPTSDPEKEKGPTSYSVYTA